MGDHNNNKRAAEAFPLKKPSSICDDVSDQVIPPTSTQESSKTQGSAGQSLILGTPTIYDGHSQSKSLKSILSNPLKGSAAVIFCDTEDSDPTLMSLGVNYGAREYYPCDTDDSGNSYEKDKKDVYDCMAPENSHEWWQGSYYY